MGKTLQKHDKAQDLMRRMQGEMAKVLPKWITPERMARMVLTSFRNVPKLYDCTEASIAKCAMQLSELGLEPGSALSLAYLIPYGKECTLIIGFRGLLEMARRTGQVKNISAEVVYANDKFDYALGLEPKLDHKPALKDRGDPVFAYAVCHLKDGGRQFEVMTVEDINKIRDKVLSKMRNKNESPWVQHWDQMARKTVLRRICKYLPAAVLPVLVQETLAVEDERVYDTTANLISEGTAKATEELRQRLENRTEETPAETPLDESRKPVPLTKKPADPPSAQPDPAWSISQMKIEKILLAAERNGWSLAQMDDWMKGMYSVADGSDMTLEKIASEDCYNEILQHFSETVQT